MPSTPETCSSIGAATVSRNVIALAPGKNAVTFTVGGVTSGYWATGSVQTATPPASVITTEITVAKIGRSMKNRDSMSEFHVSGWLDRVRARRLSVRVWMLAVQAPQPPVDAPRRRHRDDAAGEADGHPPVER